MRNALCLAVQHHVAVRAEKTGCCGLHCNVGKWVKDIVYGVVLSGKVKHDETVGVKKNEVRVGGLGCLCKVWRCGDGRGERHGKDGKGMRELKDCFFPHSGSQTLHSFWTQGVPQCVLGEGLRSV